MRRILYPSKIENGNLGDILINSLLVRELSKHSKVYLKGHPPLEMEKLIFLHNPYSKNIKILNIDFKSFILRKIKVLLILISNRKFTYVFDTPGHIFRKTSILKTLSKGFFDLFKILIYRIFNIKSIKMGITLGPFKKVEWILYKIICKLSYKICVRDNDNFELLENKKFQNINLIPDLAFLLFENNKLLKKIKGTTNNSITICLRPSLIGKTSDYVYLQQIIHKTKTLLKYLLKRNINISIINIAFQVDCDNESLMEIDNMLKSEFNNLEIIIHSKLLSFDEASELYSSSEYVITNRLHVFLFAMNVGTKAFIVTDNQKHKKLISIISDLNLNSLIFDENNLEGLNSANDLEIFGKLAINKKNELIETISNILIN